jgi:serine/threonine-protein kinase RsbW
MSEAAVADAMRDERDGVQTIRLRIPAKPEYVAVARLAVTGLAELVGVPEETRADLKLALTEAVSNSIRHAYDGETGSVDIAFALSGARLEVEVTDDGAGFGPSDRPALEGEELVEGGLGIAIIRTITDELEIESRPGVRGSRLRFVKSLDDL